MFIVMLMSGCSALDALNATVPRGSAIQTLNIAYGPSSRQHLDVYQPLGVGPHAPVVVFFYGGYWDSGSKRDYRFIAQALTSRGFEVVLPDYRVYPEVQFPAFVQDGATAVRWTHDSIAKFGGDPSQIFLMGHSAGAQIAALLTLDAHYLRDVGLDANAIRATVGLSGPYDFKLSARTAKAFGARPDESPPAIEPMNFARGDAPPMLLIHGGRDSVVDPSNSTRLAQRIVDQGGVASATILPRLDHPGVSIAMAWSFRWLGPVLKDSVEFFDKYERPKPPTTSLASPD